MDLYTIIFYSGCIVLIIQTFINLKIYSKRNEAKRILEREIVRLEEENYLLKVKCDLLEKRSKKRM